jgi:hypothetical protein
MMCATALFASQLMKKPKNVEAAAQVEMNMSDKKGTINKDPGNKEASRSGTKKVGRTT